MSPAGKTPVTGAGPYGGIAQHAVILWDAGAMPCQGIEGGERDA